LCAGESDDFPQPRSASHGPLAGESGNHVRFIHVLKSNDDTISPRHAIKNDVVVKVDNDGNSGLHV
jgi:hypothetical protein